VFIADEHEVVREGLRLILRADDRVEVVGAAGSARETVARCFRLRPDVVLVDFDLPDATGAEVCAELRARLPRTLVIVSSSHATPDGVRSSVAAGAFGYAPKPDGLRALRKALDQAIAALELGHGESSTPAAAFLVELLRETNRRRSDVTLTPQQERVQELVAEGFTNQEIADALCVSESTVRYHLQRLKALLGARSKLDLMRLAYARGFARAAGPASRAA
jgi:two-component system response regulator DevR